MGWDGMGGRVGAGVCRPRRSRGTCTGLLEDVPQLEWNGGTRPAARAHSCVRDGWAGATSARLHCLFDSVWRWCASAAMRSNRGSPRWSAAATVTSSTKISSVRRAAPVPAAAAVATATAAWPRRSSCRTSARIPVSLHAALRAHAAPLWPSCVGCKVEVYI